MTTETGSVEHAGSPELSNEQWAAFHVPRFAEARPRYVAYAAFLEALLREACAAIAPESIVTARAKTIPSFAGKILRKRQVYARTAGVSPADPLARMTDLCGARVITNHAGQVEAVCEFIERTFDIDWANSEDVSRRHRIAEFGYRSVHYIVRVDPEKLKAAGLGLEAPPVLVEPAPLKAEIQVRTLLEHAWAQLAHDTAYKAEARLSPPLQRRFSAMAAVLESADREFGSLLGELGAYRSNFGAYRNEADVEAEIAHLRIVLSQSPDSPDQAVRIASLAAGIGRHELALDVLAPYAEWRHRGVERARGLAMCEAHWDRPRSAEYIEGRRLLERACAHDTADAETLSLVAEAWRESDRTRARDLFRRASAIDSSEPLTLCRYLEFEVDHHSSAQLVSLAAPMIRAGLTRCRTQVEGRVNLPRAWACAGVFHLLLGSPTDALRAIAELIALCSPPARDRHPGAAVRELIRLRETLERFRSIRNDLAGFDALLRLVLLGLAVRAGDREASDTIRPLASSGESGAVFTAGDRVVILSGGCSPDVQPFIDASRSTFIEACNGLSVTVVSGGTPMGVSGLAGDIAAASAGRITAVGYLPRSLPAGAHADTDRRRYRDLRTTSGADFTALEPLQAWTDLAAAGVMPSQVRLVAYAGGDITRVECAVAAAFGCRVAVVDDPGLPPRRRLDDVLEQPHPGVVRLPLDRMTLRAFLLADGLIEPRADLERAARAVHERYLQSASPVEPSLRPWDELTADLKASNFHQVAYAEHILRTAGIGLRPLSDPDRPPIDLDQVVGPEGVQRLAEMEHGRWNVERLLRGWRYAPTKDVANKRSPYLVAWSQLPAEIQAIDVNAVRALPATFREAGLEVFRIQDAPDSIPSSA